MLVETPVTQCSPCYYSAVSASLMNPLPYCSNYSPFATPSFSGNLLPDCEDFKIHSAKCHWRAGPVLYRALVKSHPSGHTSDILTPMRLQLINTCLAGCFFLFFCLFVFPSLTHTILLSHDWAHDSLTVYTDDFHKNSNPTTLSSHRRFIFGQWFLRK